MNWSPEHIASTVVFTGYGIWFAVVFIRRLLAPVPPLSCAGWIATCTTASRPVWPHSE